MRIKVDITGFGDDLNKKQELNGDDARFDRCYLILETYHRDTNHKITFNDSNLVLLYGTINFVMTYPKTYAQFLIDTDLYVVFLKFLNHFNNFPINSYVIFVYKKLL